jgi:hypothetical protein
VLVASNRRAAIARPPAGSVTTTTASVSRPAPTTNPGNAGLLLPPWPQQPLQPPPQLQTAPPATATAWRADPLPPVATPLSLASRATLPTPSAAPSARKIRGIAGHHLRPPPQRPCLQPLQLKHASPQTQVTAAWVASNLRAAIVRPPAGSATTTTASAKRAALTTNLGNAGLLLPHWPRRPLPHTLQRQRAPPQT